MVSLPNRRAGMRALALALATASALGAVVPAQAAAIGSGSLALAPATAAASEVGYWYRGRYYGGCWNCGGGNGAAVGAGIALGVLGAAAIAGAAAAAPPPPPPPVVYYTPPPRVYVEPVPRPRSCWVATGPGGAGYWSPC